jgi:hypothetical protein
MILKNKYNKNFYMAVMFPYDYGTCSANAYGLLVVRGPHFGN